MRIPGLIPENRVRCIKSYRDGDVYTTRVVRQEFAFLEEKDLQILDCLEEFRATARTLGSNLPI